MNLDSMIKEGKLSRREALRMLTKGGAATLATGMLAGCGGGSNPVTGPSPPNPAPNTQLIQVYDNQGNNRGTATFETNSAGILNLNYQNLTSKGIDVSGTDNNAFVVREANQNDRIGNYTKHTLNGNVEFTATNQPRIIWLMSTANQADYIGAYEYGLGKNGILNNARYATVGKLTRANNTNNFLNVVDVEPISIIEALPFINNPIIINGIKLGSLNYVGDQSGSNFFGGTATPNNIPPYSGGWHALNLFGVTPDNNGTNRGRTVAAMEAIESIFQFDDLFGRGTWFFNSVNDTELTNLGKNYLTFAYLISKN